MPKPIVAIVGRPNVGKSTLVNRLTATRQAIVDQISGVTRDRNYVTTDWRGREFIIIDTGGIEVDREEPIVVAIRDQAMLAMEEADLILFVVDGRSGPVPGDDEIADLLRRTKKPVMLVVNKVDNPSDNTAVLSFYGLGAGDPLAVSAAQGLLVGDLLDKIVEKLPVLPEPDEVEGIAIAIVGRPNAGKSSVFNKLAGRERAVISEVPGTTRDAIDTLVKAGDRTYRFIDTAGLRKVSKLSGDLEFYGTLRAVKALESASVALLVIDSLVGVTDQDQRIARMASDKGSALIIALNKWDMIDEEAAEGVLYGLATRLGFVDYAIVVKTSAKTGRGIKKIFPAIDTVADSFNRSVSTPNLNKLLLKLREGHLPNSRGKALKLKYITQLRTGPPVFLIFVNDPKIVDESYKRYLAKRFRESFDLEGAPVRFFFRRGD